MKYFLIASVFLVGITTGYFSTIFFGEVSNSKSRTSEIREKGSYSFINPLLECEEGEDYLSKNSINSFKNIIQKSVDRVISEKKVTFASVYFRDLNGGPWFGINESEKFFPASLMKLPLLLYYLNLAEDKPSILENEIDYASGAEATPQYYPPENPVVIGKTYTVKELLEHSIRESDNNAALLLVKAAGIKKFENIFTSLGLEIPPENASNYITARTYSSFFRILFNASYVSPKYSEAALQLLSESKFKSGLTAKLPSNIVVAHKFGEAQNEFGNEKQLHDCGIIYYPKKPYILCVMTRGNNFDSLAEAIADISEATYHEISEQLK